MKLDHRTLRAIGQDLETIGVLDFDLKLDGERCVVHGMVASAAAPVSTERVYLSDDIDRLLVEGQSHRRDGPGSPKKSSRPELHSVAEILRVLAVYCETAGLQPVSVSKHGERLKYDYLTDSAVGHVEERAFSDLHSFADGMALKRSESGSERNED